MIDLAAILDFSGTLLFVGLFLVLLVSVMAGLPTRHRV
jgi:hypothetical protein